jgi:hypothetical protein
MAEQPSSIDPTADTSLAALLHQRNDAWAAAQRTNALECEVARLREVLTHHEMSVSWRVTAPLRRVGRALRPRRAAQPGSSPTPTDTSKARRA